MADDIASTVEAAATGGISGFIQKYEIIFMLVIVVTVFAAGVKCGFIYDGYEAQQDAIDAVAQRDQTIKDLQAQVKSESDALLAAGKVIDAGKATIDAYKKQTEASYDKTPANTVDCIAPIRVPFNNSARNAANDLGSR